MAVLPLAAAMVLSTSLAIRAPGSGILFLDEQMSACSASPNIQSVATASRTNMSVPLNGLLGLKLSVGFGVQQLLSS